MDGYHENWCQNKLFYKLNYLLIWETKQFAIMGKIKEKTIANLALKLHF